MRRGSRLACPAAVRVAESVVVDSSKPVLAVDFDDTICDNTGREWPDVGEPFPGVAEALAGLSEVFRIRIYSCGVNGQNAANWHEHTKRIKEYLEGHGIPFDDIVQWNEGKPFADYYIDDKGVRFTGDWAATAAGVMRDWEGKLQNEAAAVNGVVMALPVKLQELEAVSEGISI